MEQNGIIAFHCSLFALACMCNFIVGRITTFHMPHYRLYHETFRQTGTDMAFMYSLKEKLSVQASMSWTGHDCRDAKIRQNNREFGRLYTLGSQSFLTKMGSVSLCLIVGRSIYSTKWIPLCSALCITTLEEAIKISSPNCWRQQPRSNS